MAPQSESSLYLITGGVVFRSYLAAKVFSARRAAVLLVHFNRITPPNVPGHSWEQDPIPPRLILRAASANSVCEAGAREAGTSVQFLKEEEEKKRVLLFTATEKRRVHALTLPHPTL